MINIKTKLMWDEILEESNFPPVLLLTRSEYYDRTKFRLGRNLGISCPSFRIICVNQKQTENELKDTLWHELLHCLFPNNPEWWIECAAYKLSRNKYESYGFYSSQYGKSPRKDIPSRKQLIELIKDISSYIMVFGKGL